MTVTAQFLGEVVNRWICSNFKHYFANYKSEARATSQTVLDLSCVLHKNIFTMENEEKSRQEKLFGKLYPYFGDLARGSSGDEYALRVCRHLLCLRDNAISSKHIAGFIDIWNSEHPEEDELRNDELLWALDSVDDCISSHVRNNQLQQTRTNSPFARFKLIKGGRPEKAADPYAHEPDGGYKIDF